MRIDSHHHFWEYSAAEYPWIDESKLALRKDFGPEELRQAIEVSGVNAVVSVQARQSIQETSWLLEIAGSHEFVKGVVGWVPLSESNVREEIERLSHFPLLKSVRHVVQDEPRDDFILGEEFNRGVAILKDYGLVYDILILARHLPNAIQFVDRHPQQAFVLDHIAKPTIREVQFDQLWADNLRLLAKREHVTCKFSGVVTEVRDEQWSTKTLRPYWDTALEAFGPERLMFGSDWPVCLLRSSYSAWVEAVSELAGQLTPAEQQSFWGETARRAYRL